jgi:hypothetical protein
VGKEKEKKIFAGCFEGSNLATFLNNYEDTNSERATRLLELSVIRFIEKQKKFTLNNNKPLK